MQMFISFHRSQVKNFQKCIFQLIQPSKSQACLQVSKLWLHHVMQIDTPPSLMSLFHERSCQVLRCSVKTTRQKESQVFNHCSRISQEAKQEHAPAPEMFHLPHGMDMCVYTLSGVGEQLPYPANLCSCLWLDLKNPTQVFNQVLHLASRMLYFWAL